MKIEKDLLDVPMVPAQVAPREITLPSGRRAVVRTGSGEDWFDALQEVSGNSKILSAAITVRLITINKRPYTYEEFMLEPLPDVMMLYNLANELVGIGAFPPKETEKEETYHGGPEKGN